MPRATIAGRGACLFTALLLATEADKQTEARISRLSLTARQSAAVRGLSELLGQENVLDSVVLQPSEAVVVLAEKPIEAIQALALLTDRALVRERLNSYLDVWRYVRPRLSGCDIEGLGVVHGPDVGAALSVLRAARLDGRVATRDDEIQLVQEFRTKGSVTRSRRD